MSGKIGSSMAEQKQMMNMHVHQGSVNSFTLQPEEITQTSANQIMQQRHIPLSNMPQ